MSATPLRHLGPVLLALVFAAVAFLLWWDAPSGGGRTDLTPVEGPERSGASGRGDPLGDPAGAGTTTREALPPGEGARPQPPRPLYRVHGRVVGPVAGDAWRDAVVALCAGEARALDLAPRSAGRALGAILDLRDEAAVAASTPGLPDAPLAHGPLGPERTFAWELAELPPTFHVRVVGPTLVQTSWVTCRTPPRTERSPLRLEVEVVVRALGAAHVAGEVLDVQGRPVADAVVVLREVVEDLRRIRAMDRTERPPRLTRTDGAGRFAFAGVHPGEDLALRAGFGAGAAHVSARLDDLTLAAGERLETTLRLAPAHAIEGVVRDALGAPIAEALVVAGPHAAGFGHLERVDDPTGSTARTDAQGRFRIAGLAAGRHFVVAEAAGHAPSDVVAVDPAASPSAPLAIVLSAGAPLRGLVRRPDGTPAPSVPVALARQLAQTTFLATAGRPLRPVTVVTDAEGRFAFDALEIGTFDLRAETADGLWAAEARGVTNRMRRGAPRDPVELELAPRAALAGRIVEADGRPVTHFELELCSKALVVVPATRAHGAFRAVDGAFRLTGLLPGKYDLHVRVADREPHLAKDVVVPAPEDFAVVLPAVGDVRGVVVDEANGAPLEDVVLRRAKHPFEALGDVLLGTVHEARTDENGAFALRGLPAGRHTLSATHEAFVARAAFEVEVLPGDVRTDLVLRLTRGGVIEGHVYGDDGTPRVGATVEAATDPFGLQKIEATTDALGFYRLRGLPPGQARLSALDLGALADGGLASLLASVRTKTVHVEPNTTVVVDFGEGGSAGTRLVGTVTINGAPARGVMLFATFAASGRSDDVRLASSDERGAYAFENVPRGACDLRVLHMGSHGQSVHPLALTIPDVREHRFDVALEVGRLSGRVRSTAGEPLAAVQVTLRSTEAAPGEEPFVAFATTGEDGRYVFEGLRSGTYEVRAGGPQFLVAAAESVVQDLRSGLVVAGRDELTDVDFVLAPGGTIRGTVVDEAGRPVAGVALYAEPEERAAPGGVPHGLTGPDGTFALQGVAPGANSVRTQARGFLDVERVRVVVVPPTAAEVTLTVRRGIRVRVAVRDGGGQPVAGAVARLLDEAGRPVRAGVSAANLGAGYGPPADAAFLELGAFAPGGYVLEVTGAGERRERPITLRGAPGSVHEEVVRGG